jgi:NADPH:quinone reductase-like Zn-dependent oxidoreductase
LAPGDPVLLNAASSSVGLSALQVIRRAGGTPIALTRTPKKVQALRTAGATEVIVTEKEGLQQVVMKLTQNQGARVIFDAVGGNAFANLVGAAAGGGVILVYGFLSKEANSFAAIQVIRKNLHIRGVASTAALADDAKRCAFKRYVLAGLQSRVFQPRIAKIFPFEEIVEAHRYIESGEQFGKVVLSV